jgi:MFS family permease
MNGVLVVLCELPLTTITQRFPARRVMALGYLLIGSGFALNAFAHTLPLFVLVMLIFTFGEMTTMPVASAYIADLAPPHVRGRYMGMLSFTWALALVIGPGSAMALFGHGPMILWLACAGLGLFAALIILSGKD